MDYTARIKLKIGKYFIMHCGYLGVRETNCKLKDVTDEYGTLLILISHNRVQHFLDVSGIENYLFLGFDENKKFIGTTFCNTTEDRSFIISTQARFAVFISIDNLPFHPSESIELETEHYLIDS